MSYDIKNTMKHLGKIVKDRYKEVRNYRPSKTDWIIVGGSAALTATIGLLTPGTQEAIESAKATGNFAGTGSTFIAYSVIAYMYAATSLPLSASLILTKEATKWAYKNIRE